MQSVVFLGQGHAHTHAKHLKHWWSRRRGPMLFTSSATSRRRQRTRGPLPSFLQVLGVHAQQNIIDAKELRSLQKSGYKHMTRSTNHAGSINTWLVQPTMQARWLTVPLPPFCFFVLPVLHGRNQFTTPLYTDVLLCRNCQIERCTCLQSDGKKCFWIYCACILVLLGCLGPDYCCLFQQQMYFLRLGEKTDRVMPGSSSLHA